MTIIGILTAIIVAWYLTAQPWKPARKNTMIQRIY